MKLIFKYLLLPVIGLIALLLAYVLSSLMFFSEVEIDKYGIYSQWNIPLTPSFDIKTRLEKGRFQVGENNEHLNFFDGPVVFKHPDNQLLVKYYCNDQIYSVVTERETSIDCHGRHYSFNFYEPKQYETFSFDMPEKLVAIGDIHGRLETFKSLLLASEVIDDHSQWQFGEGHLVLTGDAIDRGRESIQVLWFIYQLQNQAMQAGGRVHFILGNHEHMAMANDLRYVESGHRYAIEQMMPYAESLSSKTLLGRWLKEQPHIIKLGDMLFTHGGISPSILQNESNLDSLNRQYIQSTKSGMSDESYYQVAKDPISPSWYRGYFAEAKMYPKISENELDDVLNFFDVSTIVVGHTRQQQISHYFNEKLIAIDTMDVNPQSFRIIDGKFDKVSIAKSEQASEVERTVRKFSLLNSDDRAFVANILFG